MPVTHENFRQWVIEDDFCAGRPDWDQAGATFSANVHEYEAMKIRILNGGHQILANVGEGLAAGASVEGFALVEALWARMCEGTREDGTTIEPNDPHWAELQSAASAARSTPRAWLEQRQFYGDLADKARFADAFERWLALIWTDGCLPSLKSYVQG